MRKTMLIILSVLFLGFTGCKYKEIDYGSPGYPYPTGPYYYDPGYDFGPTFYYSRYPRGYYWWGYNRHYRPRRYRHPRYRRPSRPIRRPGRVRPRPIRPGRPGGHRGGGRRGGRGRR